VKKALKGMSEKMVTGHKGTKANCWRCGGDGHDTLQYYAKNKENREEIVKAMVSAPKKWQRNDDDNSFSTTNKTAKIVAICEHLVVQHKRIWELNLDEKEDF
jgi:hypothetical protein